VNTEPLEWEWDADEGKWYAISPKWDYSIGVEDKQWTDGRNVIYARRVFVIEELIGIGSLYGWFETVEAAKAAAEQWHAERYGDEQEEYNKTTTERIGPETSIFEEIEEMCIDPGEKERWRKVREMLIQLDEEES
jgi:hypothetical protein